MDLLDIDTLNYHSIYNDMEKRLFKLYNEIEEINSLIIELDNKINNVKGDKITFENVYKMFEYFEENYENCPDSLRKEFMNALIDSVEIYPERKEDGRLIKAINFSFPIKYDVDINALKIPHKFHSDETVVLLSHRKADDYVEMVINNDEFPITSAEMKSTRK